MHYNCIACITIDSVRRIDKKKTYTGLFRRMQKKYNIKKIQMPRFINAELTNGKTKM